MTKPLPYAGYDPDEDDFEGIVLAPLRPDEIAAARRPRTRIDIERAWSLKRLGRSWGEIGRLLAIGEGRRTAYQGHSVRFAAMNATPVEKPRTAR